MGNTQQRHKKLVKIIEVCIYYIIKNKAKLTIKNMIILKGLIYSLKEKIL